MLYVAMSFTTIFKSLNIEFELLDTAIQVVKLFVILEEESYLVSYIDCIWYILTYWDSLYKFSIKVTILKELKFHITYYSSYTCNSLIYQNFHLAHFVSFLVERHRQTVAKNQNTLLT